MPDPNTYSREELDFLVDSILYYQLIHPDCYEFFDYRIRGIYVSPSVIDQAILERFENLCTPNG